ncbi:MAG TPA: cyclic nucleotide-binding domain-containing protein [Spirochaetota bacterium]|nr:cyclic nucleotide-binding domain-containing protein [Spirochaetota bacterium]
MPKVRKYKSGSVVFFDGETKGNSAFLLKSGACTRTKLSPATHKPETTPVKLGEFFGIKSALGNFPRDATVQVLRDSVIYEFTPQEFEAVSKSKVSIIFQMLKAFSNELRKIHGAIDSILTKDTEGEEAFDQRDKLMYIGNYYYNNKAYDQARYAFKKFLQYNPQSSFTQEVNNKLRDINNILKFKNKSAAAAGSAGIQPESAAAEHSRFQLMEGTDDFKSPIGTGPMLEKYNEVIADYQQGDFKKCLQKINQLKNQLGSSMPDGDLYERIFLTAARVYYYNEKYNEAIDIVKKIAGRYKRSPWLYYALAVMAACYKAMGNDNNAKTIYNKIVSQSSDSHLTGQVKKKLTSS